MGHWGSARRSPCTAQTRANSRHQASKTLDAGHLIRRRDAGSRAAAEAQQHTQRHRPATEDIAGYPLEVFAHYGLPILRSQAGVVQGPQGVAREGGQQPVSSSWLDASVVGHRR